jgi:hypothetical protein
MFIGKSAVQELLELMMEYLDQKTIAACALVNQQFSATAYRLLYRTILFNERPEHLYNQGLQWRTLLQFPHLCCHTRYFVINVWQEGKRRRASVTIERPLDNAVLDSLPPYTERVAFVLQHATNLIEVKLEDHRPDFPLAAGKIGLVILNSIIRSLNEMTTNPELSLNIKYTTLASGEEYEGSLEPEREKLRDGLLQIRDKFRVTTLSCDANVAISKKCMEVIAGFRHLRKLSICSLLQCAEHFLDFNKMFRNIPITEFLIGDIHTLPRSLQTLVIGGKCYLSQQTWAAVCNLQNLQTLKLGYSRPDDNRILEIWNNDTIYRFKSSNLRVFDLGLFGNSSLDENLINSHILQPVLTSCELEHMAFEMGAIPLSSLLLESCFAPFLSRLVLAASASPYSFECLANGLKKSPNLKQWASRGPPLWVTALSFPTSRSFLTAPKSAIFQNDLHFDKHSISLVCVPSSTKLNSTLTTIMRRLLKSSVGKISLSLMTTSGKFRRICLSIQKSWGRNVVDITPSFSCSR